MNFIKIMMILSLLSLCWWRSNIIMLLLSLEFLLSSMFISLTFSNLISAPLSILIMLVIMVSSSSMGLSLLVSISHSHNSSNSLYINMLN